MRATLGPRAAPLHLLLVSAVALTGLGLLLMVVNEMAFGPDPYSRDMAILGLIIFAPMWLFGLVAAFEAVSVLRGRRVTRRAALGWALLILAGGTLLAVTGGQATLLANLITRPDLVALDWPALVLITPDNMGSSYLYVDQPRFWLPIAAIVLSLASLAALAGDVYGDRRPRPAGPHHDVAAST